MAPPHAPALRVALIVAVAACSPTTSPSPSSETRAATPGASGIDVSCTPDRQAPDYLGDPCPAVTVAVELAVAPVRLPIAQVIIEPGPFYCDDVWPGAGSEAPCYGPNVQPGQFMHAWVSFTGSSNVAAVMVGRDLPSATASPAPTAPPWTATLVRVEVPPAGWSVP